MPSARRDAISAIGITVIKNGEITDNYYTLVDPECEFDDFTVELTGITPEKAERYPNFGALWSGIEPYLENAVLAAHGAQGDLHVLSRTLRRYGIEWVDRVDYICTFEAAKRCFPELPGYSLNKISDSLGIPLEHHVASSDSFAAAMILLKCAERVPEILDDTKIYSVSSAFSVSDAAQKKRTQLEAINKDISNFVSKKFAAVQKKSLAGKTAYKVLGVKPSLLKKYSAKVVSRGAGNEFIAKLPHTLYEENMLHAYLICRIKDFDACMDRTERFLPYIDDDAVFFALNPRALGADRKELRKKCLGWLSSPEPYIRAFAVRMLARWFTSEEDADTDISEKIASFPDAEGTVFLCAADYFFRLMKFGGESGRECTYLAAESSRAAARGIEFYLSDASNGQTDQGANNC